MTKHILQSIFLLLSLAFTGTAFSQPCESKVTITLRNNKGGVYSGQTVTLKNKADGKEYKQKSDAKGEALLLVPCEQLYDLLVTNYTSKREIASPPKGGWAMEEFSYSPDMAQKDVLFAMSAPEIAAVDKSASSLPDTTYIKNGVMVKPANGEHFSSCILTLTNIDNQPLAGEKVVFSGIKRKKSFKGTTDGKGNLVLFLPKGDEYTLNFKHHQNYKSQEVKYTKGSADAKLTVSYLGTVEIERRKKAEEERIKAEEKRLAAEKAAFEAECRRMKIAEKEGHKRALKENYSGGDPVVSKVLERNKWTDKLIVCDLTGSMTPYANQLSAWYQLNLKTEQKLQFVFFNDGDNKSDERKEIGATGGIYYQPAKGLDSLIELMSLVRHAGSGGDCAENNMEALIKGVKLAKPYKELVMIVDNHAPVKDLSLLKNFNKPVHIILCGSYSGQVLLDYLLIAWKTKGSIHTIEEDITKIAGMLEDQSIMIGGTTYRIMGGEFVKVTRN